MKKKPDAILIGMIFFTVIFCFTAFVLIDTFLAPAVYTVVDEPTEKPTEAPTATPEPTIQK